MATVLALAATAGPLRAQEEAVADLELEQELSRPYAYVARLLDAGFDIMDLSDPASPRAILEWRIENADLHRGIGAMDAKYFKHDGRYYFVQSFQFFPGGPDGDLGAIVFDVTDLPDASKVKEVGRIRAPDYPTGFHNIFMYKHSDGRPLLFTTTSGPFVNVYDMARFLDGDEAYGLVAQIPVPEGPMGSTAITTSTSASIRVRARTSSTAEARAGTTFTTSRIWTT
jgi:hypothetical protein